MGKSKKKLRKSLQRKDRKAARNAEMDMDDKPLEAITKKPVSGFGVSSLSIALDDIDGDIGHRPVTRQQTAGYADHATATSMFGALSLVVSDRRVPRHTESFRPGGPRLSIGELSLGQDEKSTKLIRTGMGSRSISDSNIPAAKTKYDALAVTTENSKKCQNHRVKRRKNRAKEKGLAHMDALEARVLLLEEKREKKSRLKSIY